MLRMCASAGFRKAGRLPYTLQRKLEALVSSITLAGKNEPHRNLAKLSFCAPAHLPASLFKLWGQEARGQGPRRLQQGVP